MNDTDLKSPFSNVLVGVRGWRFISLRLRKLHTAKSGTVIYHYMASYYSKE